MSQTASPRSLQARKRLQFGDDEESDGLTENYATQMNTANDDQVTPRRLSLGSIDTIVEDDTQKTPRTPDGRRTPSPQSSPSRVPSTPTPNKTSRFFPASARQSAANNLSNTPSKASKKALRFSDGALSKPDLIFTPPTPLVDHNNQHVFKTPAKASAPSERLFSQSGVNFGDSTVTLSTNFNPFSPLRAPSQDMKVKADSSTVSRFVTDFEMVEELGRGSFGVVYKCINRTDGWTYAVKKITYKSKKIRKHMLKEAFALAALGQHPNIVRYYSSWENKIAKMKTSTNTVQTNTQNPGAAFSLKASSANLFSTNVVHEKQIQSALYIQTEFCEGGSLWQQRKRGVAFTQDLLVRILRQLASALAHMHERNFSHGDIKPANILVDTELVTHSTVFKLGDLGQINSDGDGKYLAPEMLGFGFGEDEPIDPTGMARADIFSLGITIFELAYEWSTSRELTGDRSLIAQKDIQLPQDRYTHEFLELLKVMLRSDPNARPTAKDLLTHPLLLSEMELRIRHETQMRARAEAELSQAQRHIQELEQAMVALNLGSNSTCYVPASASSSALFSPQSSSKFTPRSSSSNSSSTPLRHGSASSLFTSHPVPVPTPQNKRPRSLSFSQMERSDVVADIILPPSPLANSTASFDLPGRVPQFPSFSSSSQSQSQSQSLSMMDIDDEGASAPSHRR